MAILSNNNNIRLILNELILNVYHVEGTSVGLAQSVERKALNFVAVVQAPRWALKLYVNVRCKLANTPNRGQAFSYLFYVNLLISVNFLSKLLCQFSYFIF